MFTSIEIFILLCITLQCNAEIQLFKNQLSEDAKTLAIGTVEREILIFNHSDAVIAQTLCGDFSKLYGEKWTCFVGLKGFIEGLIPAINAAPNTTLWFAYNTTHVLLFKSNQCETTSNTSNTYKDTINGALDYRITYNYTNFNITIQTGILKIIKDAIKAEVGVDCTKIASNNWNDAYNCYSNISYGIRAKLTSVYGDNKLSVSDGRVNSGMVAAVYNKRVYQVVFNDIIDFIITTQE